MVKKTLKIVIVILAILSIALISTFKVYAIDEEKISFVSILKDTAEPGETLQITLDLTKIKYSKYTVELETSTASETPEISNGATGEKILGIEDATEAINKLDNDTNSNKGDTTSNTDNIPELETSSDNKTFTIYNIENLESLIITYSVPETAKPGEKITINITVSSLDEYSQKINTSVENLIENDTNENITNSDSTNIQDKMQAQITITVTEKQESDKNNNTENNQNGDENQNNQYEVTPNKNQSANSQENTQSTTSNKTQVTVTGTQSSVQTVTYNGSSDNYLTEISINDEALENFSKTNKTYFKTVSEDTTSVSVSYEKSDSDSTVCIYGNTDLKAGLNKILITVTAENGNVRNYRIYVTVK